MAWWLDGRMWFAWVAVAFAVPEGFWAHWGDGRAEVSAYALTIPRYGELRKGEAVLVFVTETFTSGQRVKSDGGHPDEFPVLKLNTMVDFQTGVYDYDTTTSTFLPLDGRQAMGVPTKLAFSAQEWCGVVFDEVRVDGPVARWTSHSYFDGEGDRYRVLAVPDDAVFADALPILVRNVVGDWLAPGATREVHLVPSFLELRLAHRDPIWEVAQVSRSASSSVVSTVLGAVEAWTITVEGPGPAQTTWTVEAASPNRLLGWVRSDGFTGTLTGSTRSAYWTQHGEGGEALRLDLGLPPDAWHPVAAP